MAIVAIFLTLISSSKSDYCVHGLSAKPEGENVEKCLEVSYKEFKVSGVPDCSIEQFLTGFGQLPVKNKNRPSMKEICPYSPPTAKKGKRMTCFCKTDLMECYRKLEERFRRIPNKESGLCIVRKMNRTDFVKYLIVERNKNNERRRNEALEEYRRQSKAILDGAKFHLLLLAILMDLAMGVQLAVLTICRKNLRDHHESFVQYQSLVKDGNVGGNPEGTGEKKKDGQLGKGSKESSTKPSAGSKESSTKPQAGSKEPSTKPLVGSKESPRKPLAGSKESSTKPQADSKESLTKPFYAESLGSDKEVDLYMLKF